MTLTVNPRMPRGMSLNNPGNLRHGVGMEYAAKIVNGFASFQTIEDGTYALCTLVDQYYTHLGHKTLSAFIGTYAPASENDVIKYQTLMAQFCRLSILTRDTADLRLDRASYALDWIRALIRVEQGSCERTWRTYPEWVSPRMIMAQMERRSLWKDQL